jgi:arginyl-tRNA--protein-N-Asp/Glu arginylyltransferase
VKEVLDIRRCLQCPYVVLGDADDVGSARGVSSYRQQSHTQPRREGLTSAPTRLSVNQSVSQSVNQLVNQSINQIVSQLVSHGFMESIKRTIVPLQCRNCRCYLSLRSICFSYLIA